MDSIKIPYNKPFIAGNELSYIDQAVNEFGHTAGDGPFTKKCHAWLEERLGCRKALLTHSCTAALEMAAILCDITLGDEIIMPSFTFVSTANAFVLRGGTPVFVDIRPDTLNIDDSLIESAITEKTRAIVPVHYAGVACDMDIISDIAQRHDLLVIEDAAQALLSTYKGRCLGALGHLGCLSFHETKNVISGEGGALLVNDARFEERAEIVRQKGTNREKYQRGEVDKYTWVDVGSSFLPGELTAAFLYAQLEQSSKIIRKRRSLYYSYLELLADLAERELICLPYTEEKCVSNGHIFYILTRSPEERTCLIDFLKSRSILGVFHYVPLHSSPAGKKYGRTWGNMSVTDDVSRRILRLPLYYEMTQSDLEEVATAIKAFFKENRNGKA